jgi:hypothetical protein
MKIGLAQLAKKKVRPITQTWTQEAHIVLTFILASFKFTIVTKLNLLAKIMELARRMEMNSFANATKIGLAQLARKKVS